MIFTFPGLKALSWGPTKTAAVLLFSIGDPNGFDFVLLQDPVDLGVNIPALRPNYI